MQSPFFDWIADLNLMATVTVSLSTVLSAIAILTYLIFPSKRSFPIRLPVYMLIASFGFSLSILLGILQGPCYLQSVGMYYFGTASWLWWAIISFNFYDVIVRGNTSIVQSREKLYNFIAWPVAFVFLVVCLVFDKLDQTRRATFWECFVRDNPTYSQYVFFYGWLGLASFLGLFVWPRCLLRLYHLHIYYSGSRTEGLKLLAYGRHMLFMILFFLYFVILVVFRIQSHVSQRTYVIAMIHTFTVSSLGCWLFLIFGVSKQNFDLWIHFIRTGKRVIEEPDYTIASTIGEGLLQNDYALEDTNNSINDSSRRNSRRHSDQRNQFGNGNLEDNSMNSYNDDDSHDRDLENEQEHELYDDYNNDSYIQSSQLQKKHKNQQQMRQGGQNQTKKQKQRDKQNSNANTSDSNILASFDTGNELPDYNHHGYLDNSIRDDSISGYANNIHDYQSDLQSMSDITDITDFNRLDNTNMIHDGNESSDINSDFNDQNEYNQNGYNQGGYDQGGYDQDGYEQGGYEQGGYEQNEFFDDNQSYGDYQQDQTDGDDPSSQYGIQPSGGQ